MDYSKLNKEELLRLLDIKDEEIKQLHQILTRYNIDYPKLENKPKISKLERLLNVINRLFVCNKDVYAKRFISKNKTGYSPVCKNRFSNLCNYKCDTCKYKAYLPLTDDVIKEHLTGRIHIGIYPIFNTNQCGFLAFDFDDESFKESSKALSKILRENNLEHIIEISSSGSGSHIWVFFNEGVEASKVRKMGNLLLTHLISDLEIDMDAYDRMFPSQDSVKDGLGNLISLPLQGKLYLENKTILVDSEFNKITDPISYLESIKSNSLNMIDKIISKYENFTIEDDNPHLFRDDITLILDNQIYIDKKYLTTKGIYALKRASSFYNKEYFKRKRMHLSVHSTPKIITSFVTSFDKVSLPIGILNKIIKLLDKNRVKYHIEDKRAIGTSIDITFSANLLAEQEEAVRKMLLWDNGILVAHPGFGKTVVAIYMMTMLRVNTLILVNTKTLCGQWKERLTQFIKFNDTDLLIGEVHSTKKKITGKIDICLYQSLESTKDIIKNNYGLVLCDEIHHAAAYKFEEALKLLNAKHIYGFTATIERSDMLQELIFNTIGPVRYEAKKIDSGFSRLLIPRFSSFKLKKEEYNLPYNDLLTKITENEIRNELIIKDILSAYNSNKTILVLSSRVAHCKYLEEALHKENVHTFLIYGAIPEKEVIRLKEEMLKIESNYVLISTGKYIGEGFDNPKLDTLFITTPFRWKGTLEQYTGRLNRKTEAYKKVIVYDYVDINIQTLARMYHERLKGYKSQNFIVKDNDTMHDTFIFSVDNYLKELVTSLEDAKTEVVFLISYQNENKVALLKKAIKVELKLVENADINAIIIDKMMVWYGGINPFSFKKSDDYIMKIEDYKLASELIKEVICDE